MKSIFAIIDEHIGEADKQSRAEFADNRTDAVRQWRAVVSAMKSLRADLDDALRAPVMGSSLREWIEGMSVSVDVSTSEEDAGYRYFGTVTEVMDAPDDKHGVTLLVQDAKPNFTSAPSTPPPSAQAVADLCKRKTLDLMHEYRITNGDRLYAALMSVASPQPSAQGEPVAWLRQDWSGSGPSSLSFDGPPDPKPVRDEVVNPVWTPLYASAPSTPPPAVVEAVPLRGEQIVEMARRLAPRLAGLIDVPEWIVPFAHAIERAHGIAPKAAQPGDPK